MGRAWLRPRSAARICRRCGAGRPEVETWSSIPTLHAAGAKPQLLQFIEKFIALELGRRHISAEALARIEAEGCRNADVLAVHTEAMRLFASHFGPFRPLLARFVRACELESAAALAAETERDLAHARLRSIQDEADEKRRMSCPLASSPFPPEPNVRVCAPTHTHTHSHRPHPTTPPHPSTHHTPRRMRAGCAHFARDIAPRRANVHPATLRRKNGTSPPYRNGIAHPD